MGVLASPEMPFPNAKGWGSGDICWHGFWMR